MNVSGLVIRSIVWIAAVVLASPFLIEALDRRDIVFAVPGLPVTTAEVLFAAVLALAPPGIVLVWRKLRPEADRAVRTK